MAVSVAYSTLLVLLSGSGKHLMYLWNSGGGVNDPSQNKHELDVQDVINGGSFRSGLIDDWVWEKYDAVSIYGMNMFGDIFWETEFNTTGLGSLYIDDWARGEYLTWSWADNNVPQTSTYNYENYKMRFSSSNGTSWFAVSYGYIPFYGPLPQIFVARSTSTPFADPVFLSGALGCWSMADLKNVVFMYSDSGGTFPADCIETCKDNASVAIMSAGSRCNCGDKKDGVEPTNNDMNCYVPCPGSSVDYCGGLSSSDGSAYHVPGTILPGTVNILPFYRATRYNINTTIQFDGPQLPLTSDLMFVTGIRVNLSAPQALTFTVWYSDLDCVEAAGDLKNVSFNTPDPTEFAANDSTAEVDILRVRCLELRFSDPVDEATVDLLGPDVTSEHIEVPAVVIRGKHFTEVTTSYSSTTSTSAATTSTSTSTSSTTTTPTTTPTTTATTPSTTSTTATTPSTTTTIATTPSTTSTTVTTPSTTTTTATTPSTTSTTTTTPSTTATTATTPSTTTTTTTTTNTPSTTTSTTTSSPSTSTSSSTTSTTPSSTSTTSTTTNSATTSSTTTSTPSATTTSTLPATATESTTILSTTTTSTPVSSTSTSPSSSTQQSSDSSTSSTTTSASFSTGSAAPDSTTESVCFCPCNMTIKQLNLTTAELEEKILEIQRRLTVNVSTLSSTIRKLTSAEDSRVSAVSIGYLGVGILVIILASIVFIDSAVLFRDIKKLLDNIKSGLCRCCVNESPDIIAAS